jgi:hypothetical protein
VICALKARRFDPQNLPKLSTAENLYKNQCIVDF